MTCEDLVAQGQVIQPDVRTRNRRKRYLDTNPEYFSGDLEFAGRLPLSHLTYAILTHPDPLLYDRLIRRFQSAEERSAEGRAKGYAAVLQADIFRSEAKMDALAKPDANVTLAFKRGPDGGIIEEDVNENPETKDEGREMWREHMASRFVQGRDTDFDYEKVDANDEYDDRALQEEAAEESYFAAEIPDNVLGEHKTLEGESGVQDY